MSKKSLFQAGFESGNLRRLAHAPDPQEFFENFEETKVKVVKKVENGKNAFGVISINFGIFGNLRTKVRLGLKSKVRFEE